MTSGRSWIHSFQSDRAGWLRLKLDEVMEERRMSLTDLAHRVGIGDVPMAIEVERRPDRRDPFVPGHAHLDSMVLCIMMLPMRTTVTLDEDVLRLLRDAMHRSRRSFKEALNSALRAGLGSRPVQAKTPPFALKARPLGLRPGIDPARFNQMADELEDEAFIGRDRRLSKP